MKEKNTSYINKGYRTFENCEDKIDGITLIALVVTIVILIILATVSVNIVLGENGIIGRAQSAQRMQKLAEEKEQMELIKAIIAIDNKGKIPADKYIEKLVQENIIKDTGEEYIEGGSIQVETKMNRVLKVETDENGNVTSISESEKEDKPTVIIQSLQLTEKTSSIKLEIEVEQAENATYRYFYKEETGEYTKVYEGNDLNFTIDKLKSGTSYWIKVEATNDYGTVSKEKLGKTKEIKKGQETVADLSKVGEYNDKFSMKISEIYIDNLGTVTEELFIEAIKKEGSIVKENIMTNSNGNYEMITNEGYVFEVVLKSKNNIEVTYIGIAEK